MKAFIFSLALFCLPATAQNQNSPDYRAGQAAAAAQADVSDIQLQQQAQCQSDKTLYKQQNPRSVLIPSCAGLREFVVRYQQQQTAKQTLAILFSGPDGKHWLEAYAWVRTNGCQAERIPFHPNKSKQAKQAYEQKRLVLSSDELQRVIFLCGK